MALIQESHLITASNTDILAAPSRLSAIPRGGVLTLEYSALESNGTNNFTITCQTPEGDVPFENLLVPYNGYNTGNYTNHSDTRLRFQFTATQGGHFLLSCTETGSNGMILYSSLVF